MKKVFLLLLIGLSLFGSKLYAQCGTTNISIGKSVTSSSEKDGFSVDDYAIDGLTSTNWKSDGTGTQWIMVNLAQAYTVCEIKLKWASSAFNAKSYKIYVSNSSSPASTDEVYSTTTAAGGDNTITLQTPKSGQYVKVEATEPGASWVGNYELIEFEIYEGTGNPPPPSSGGPSWLITGNDNIGDDHFLGTTIDKAVVIKTNGQERMRITELGKVLIKTSVVPNAEADLAVNGVIYAKKLKVTQANWADFVFDSTYKLLPLAEVEKYIAAHKHLPDVPSALEIEKNGLNVGDQQAVLLRKVEELTLYVIQQQKQIEELKKQLPRKRKTKK